MEETSGSRVIAATVTALPRSAAERFGENVAARFKTGESWDELTYGCYIARVAVWVWPLIKLAKQRVQTNFHRGLIEQIPNEAVRSGSNLNNGMGFVQFGRAEKMGQDLAPVIFE